MSTCIALQNPIFKPAMRLIASISTSLPMLVTTTFAHGYVSGTIVRLDLPLAVGMQQANQQTGSLRVTSPTSFTLPIDSSSFEPFSLPVSPPPYVNTCAQVIPIGEDNNLLTAAVQNVLPYGAL